MKITELDASIIKGMLARGDTQQCVAAWWGGEINSGRVAEINTGAKFSHVAAATEGLPPPGPYVSGRDAHRALLVLQPMLEAQLTITERVCSLKATSERHCKSIQEAIDALRGGNGK